MLQDIVKREFLHKEKPCGNFYGTEKSAGFVGYSRNDLCKPLMYISPLIDCGKPLLKSLWRMWKNHSFQQVFRVFRKAAIHVENSA